MVRDEVMGKLKKKNVWNYILIVIVILGIPVGYLSYLQDKKMDKMEEELDKKKMEQKDPHSQEEFPIVSLLQTLNVDSKAYRQSSIAGAVSWSCSLLDLDIGLIRLNLRDAPTQEITAVANPIYLGRS
tara:strand:- start:15361 stop:15744 length:384 start_codon:yes stop_codon:yes gene_type:complete